MPSERSERAAVIKAFVRKLPKLDMEWSEERQEEWWNCAEALMAEGRRATRGRIAGLEVCLATATTALQEIASIQCAETLELEETCREISIGQAHWCGTCIARDALQKIGEE